MSTKVKEQSSAVTGITQVNTDYSFSLTPSSANPTTSSTSLNLTSDWFVPVLEDGKPTEKPVVIEKAKVKRPYYPSDEMYGCVGNRLLAASGNMQQPFKDVSHGGQPQQFYAPYSRGGVRLFQNPTMYKSLSSATPAPVKTSLNCAFPVPRATRKSVIPCKGEDTEYAVTTSDTLEKIDLNKRVGQDKLLPYLPSSAVSPIRAQVSLSGRFRGYGGVIALSGSQIQRNSNCSDLHLRKPYRPVKTIS